ncbi:hypothetical protein [Chryseobacterium mucoviscidosis]|uniref:hypothetical protein n=1 Tax=Chryseobacterium mucoviscidosis TaxID=1945581 RepID=UPI003015DC3E
MPTSTNFINIEPIDNLDEITSLITDANMLVVRKSDGKAFKISTEAFYQILNKFAKALKLTDPTPTIDGWYKPEGPGTYTNAGGSIAEDGYDTLFEKIGSTWTVVKTKMPVSRDEDFASKIISIKNGSLNPELPIEITNMTGIPVVKVADNVLPTVLKKSGLQYFYKKTKTASGNIELYPQINEQNAIMPKEGNFIRISYIVFGMDNPPVALQYGTDVRQRLFIYNPSSVTNISPLRAENSTIGAKTYKVDLYYQIPSDFLNLNQIMLEIILETTDYIPIGTDLYFGGINVSVSNNEKFGINNELSGSQANAALTLARKTQDDVSAIVNNLEGFNNIEFNQTGIAPFLKKYISKEVDEFNQITIGLTGDSIFGRQDNSGFNPSAPEISLTEDFNNPSETQPGYVTGHFPPNMWEKLIGYKVLKMMQYIDADVKYYNHVAAEITKSGNWVNAFPVGNDNLRLATVTNVNSYIQLTFDSASFVKFIYSCYITDSMNRKIKVTFSEDGGATWKTPAQLSLVESYPSDAEGSGVYYLSSQRLKWGNLMWKGLDNTKTYKIRVQKMDNTDPLAVWGFESWSNPRVNVVISAEGANTAYNQALRPDRFYTSFYNQDLIIYNTPYLNDLGSGFITQYRGTINLSTATPSSPAASDFYYVTATGTYTNFGNLKLYVGDYVEWTGSAWRKGSGQIDFAFAVFLSENKKVYERMSKIGIPILCMITHNSLSFADRPFSELGVKYQRLFLKEYGFPTIDINRYQQVKNISNITSADGTHLNDAGVTMYADQIASVLLANNKYVGISAGKFKLEVLRGTASGNTVDFEFEFKKVPTIRIFNNSGISISAVTKKGFITTGSGSYQWEAFI